MSANYSYDIYYRANSESYGNNIDDVLNFLDSLPSASREQYNQVQDLLPKQSVILDNGYKIVCV